MFSPRTPTRLRSHAKSPTPTPLAGTKSTPRGLEHERRTTRSNSRMGAPPTPYTPGKRRQGGFVIPKKSDTGPARSPSPVLFSPRPSAFPALAAHVKQTVISSGAKATDETKIFLNEFDRLSGGLYYSGPAERMAEILAKERRKVSMIMQERMQEQEVKDEQEKQKGRKKRVAKENTEEEVHGAVRERRSRRKKRRTNNGTVDCGVQTQTLSELARGFTPPPPDAAEASTLPPTPPKTPARKQAAGQDAEQSVECEEISQAKQEMEEARRAAEEAAQHEEAVRAASVAARAVAKAESLRRQASLDLALREQEMLEREAREARAQAAREAEAANAAHLIALAEQKLEEAKEAERRAKEEAERMRIEEEERRKESETRRVAEEMARSLAEKARRRSEELLAQAEEIEARLRAAAERAEEEARLRELEARLVAAVEAAEARLVQLRQTFEDQCTELGQTLLSLQAHEERVAVLARVRALYEHYVPHVEMYKAEMERIAVECASWAPPACFEYVKNTADARLDLETQCRVAFERAWLEQTDNVSKGEPVPEESLVDVPMREASRADIPMRDASGFMDRSMASVTDDTPYADASFSEDGDFDIPQANFNDSDDSFPSDTEMDSAAPSRCSTPRPRASPLPSFSEPAMKPSPPPVPAPLPPTTLADFFQEWETNWEAVMRSDKEKLLSNTHFSSLPWPVLDAAHPCALPVYVQAAEDITLTRVQCFVDAYAAHYGLLGGASTTMKKKVNAWLTAYHSDKSDRQVVDRLHEVHQDPAKEIFQACTIELVNVRNMLG